MLAHKSFKNAVALTAWANRNHIDVVTVTVQPDTQLACFYREAGAGPEPETPGAARLRALLERVRTHMDYPMTTKKRLLFPKALLDFRVVPFARVQNSLRNLKAFAGVGYDELSTFMLENLPREGYKILTRTAAAEEYGVKAMLIEEDPNNADVELPRERKAK